MEIMALWRVCAHHVSIMHTHACTHIAECNNVQTCACTLSLCHKGYHDVYRDTSRPNPHGFHVLMCLYTCTCHGMVACAHMFAHLHNANICTCVGVPFAPHGITYRIIHIMGIMAPSIPEGIEVIWGSRCLDPRLRTCCDPF